MRQYLKFVALIGLIGLFSISTFAGENVACFRSAQDILNNKPPVPEWSGYSDPYGDGPEIDFGQSLTVYCLAPNSPNKQVWGHSGCGCQLFINTQKLKYHSKEYQVSSIMSYQPCAGEQQKKGCFNAYVP